MLRPSAVARSTIRSRVVKSYVSGAGWVCAQAKTPSVTVSIPAASNSR
jgi:hypothetical protein